MPVLPVACIVALRAAVRVDARRVVVAAKLPSGAPPVRCIVTFTRWKGSAHGKLMRRSLEAPEAFICAAFRLSARLELHGAVPPSRTDPPLLILAAAIGWDRAALCIWVVLPLVAAKVALLTAGGITAVAIRLGALTSGGRCREQHKPRRTSHRESKVQATTAGRGLCGDARGR